MTSKDISHKIATQIYAENTLKNPFAKSMMGLSESPMAYEDNDLLDLAMSRIPLETIYQAAEEKFSKDPSWGEQDYCIQELVVWFKNHFFAWVNSPVCDICAGETTGQGMVAPTPEEAKDNASRVEIYKCNVCSATVRFPRYGSLRKLLDTRRGRCGEFANCFSLLCRAMGSRVRWVWNKEDHVWSEVYSEVQKRWVHFDPSEGIFDKPLVYTDGWGKKMSYCIAFSNEGAVDVTRRYVRDPTKKLPRKECKEYVLIWALKLITDKRRAALGLSAEDLKELEQQDLAEQKELEGYVSGYNNKPSVANSALGPRESGAGDWTKARGEDGSK